MYVRCVVQTGAYEGHKFFTPLQMKEVVDHNYITLHLHRALLSQSFRRNEVLDEQYSGQKGMGDSDRKISVAGESLLVEEVSVSYRKGFEALNDRILTFIQKTGDRSRRPVPLATIIGNFRAESGVQDIRAALDELKEQAMIRKMRDADEYEVY